MALSRGIEISDVIVQSYFDVNHLIFFVIDAPKVFFNGV
jgi:hypothetical protein